MTNESNFTISKTTRGDVRIITVSGELDIATSPQLRDVLSNAEEMHHLVVMDLTAVSFIDSTTLSVLIAGVRQLRESGDDLRLVGMQPQVARVIDVTGLSAVFPIYDNVEDAMSVSEPNSEWRP